VNVISPKPNSTTSSFEALNKSVLDSDKPLEYDSPISKKGGAMIPEALEYAQNSAMIHITGGTRKKQKMVKEAARWMLGYALGSRLANNIELEIHFEESLKDTPVFASVFWEDSNHKPRAFDMELCNHIKDRLLFRVLAHEIVHIRQYATGQLKDMAIKVDYCRWKNKLVKVEGEGRVKYWDLPWEVDARKHEKEIFKAWRDAHGYHFKQKTGELYK
jgi:hypothetical protein